MKNFVKLTLNPSGDPIYVAVDKIISVNVSHDMDAHKGTIVGVSRDIYPFFVVKESPDSVMNLINNVMRPDNSNLVDVDANTYTFIYGNERINVNLGRMDVMVPVNGGKGKRKFEIIEV